MTLVEMQAKKKSSLQIARCRRKKATNRYEKGNKNSFFFIILLFIYFPLLVDGTHVIRLCQDMEFVEFIASTASIPSNRTLNVEIN